MRGAQYRDSQKSLSNANFLFQKLEGLIRI